MESHRQSYAALRTVIGRCPAAFLGIQELRSMQRTAVNQSYAHPRRLAGRRHSENPIEIALAIEIVAASAEDSGHDRNQASNGQSGDDNASEGWLRREIANTSGTAPGLQ